MAEPDWLSALKAATTAHVVGEGHPLFVSSTSVFNYAVASKSKAVALVRSAQEVADIILFTQSREISISVKGGGFNTAGWSVHGDVIIDLSQFDSIDVHLPTSSGVDGQVPGWENLKRFGTEVKMEEDAEQVRHGKKRAAEDVYTETGTPSDESRTSGSRSESPAVQYNPSGLVVPAARTGTGSSSSMSRASSDDKFVSDGDVEASRRGYSSSTPLTSESPTKSPSEGWNDRDKTRDGSQVSGGETRSIGLAAKRPALGQRHSSQPAYHPFTDALPFASSFHNTPLPTDSFPFNLSSPGVAQSNQTGPSPDWLIEAARRRAAAAGDLPPAAVGPSGSSSRRRTNLEAPPALVTIGSGAKSKAIDLTTSKYGYHVPLAAYPVGCSIFSTGGYGFLSRMFGLSMDVVQEAEIVTMDGQVRHLFLEEGNEEAWEALSEEERSDMEELWWAFRGAGTVIGVITRVRVKAFRIDSVYSGNLIYPFNSATAASLIKHWRDCSKSAPRELFTNLILTAGPDQKSHVMVIQLCYLGLKDECEGFLSSLMSWTGEICLLKDVEMRSFLTQQDSIAQVLTSQADHRWCLRAELINSLSDECIHRTVSSFRDMPARSAWLFEIAGGAIGDVPEEKTCFPSSLRKTQFQVVAIHQWKAAEEDAQWITAACTWIDDVVAKESAGGSFPCFLEGVEGTEKVIGTFGGGSNWDRLRKVRARWDPSRLLKHTFWPRNSREEEPEHARPALASQASWSRESQP